MEERAKLGLKPDEPLKDKKVCAMLRQKVTDVIQDGIAMLEKALQLRPDYDDAIYNLGVLQLTQRRRDEAIVQYHKLITLNSVLANALYGGLYKGMILDQRNK